MSRFVYLNCSQLHGIQDFCFDMKQKIFIHFSAGIACVFIFTVFQKQALLFVYLNPQGSIRPMLERRGVPGLLRGLFGPRRLRPELLQERDLLFCIAHCPLSNSEPLHLQMLQTIYKRLTGTRADCPRYGTHWDIIGFQVPDIKPISNYNLHDAFYIFYTKCN